MQNIKNALRYNHGTRNENLCTYLHFKNEFIDWVITAAFYSAVQFVTYKIFPFEFQIFKDVQSITVNNIDELMVRRGHQKTCPAKHDVLADLVSQFCHPVSEDYEWLLSASGNARYKDYQFPPEYGQKARKLLQRIKSHCQLQIV